MSNLPTLPTASAIGEDDHWILKVMSPEDAQTLENRLLRVATQEISTVSITLTMTCNSAIATCLAYRKRGATGDQEAWEHIEEVVKNFIDATEFRLEEYDINIDEEE